MLTMSASICASASYDFYADTNGQRIFYNITGTNTCEVTNNGEQTYTDDVEIPETVRNGSTTYTVTGIRTFAFDYCPRLSSVTIPSTVTSIGDYAFFDCTSLKSVTSYIINVFETNDDIFYGSDNVTLYVPKGTKSQYENTFSWNRAKKIQELPYSFKLKSAYNDVTIYYTITGTNTCEVASAVDKSNFTSADTDDTYTGEVYIPSIANGYRVTGISSKAFMCCDNLTYVSIPSSVKSIGNYAFEYCTSLATMQIPNSVTSIGAYAFYYCQKLSSLTIGNSVGSIGTYAFARCRKLTSVTIPSSISTIDSYTFYECSGLTSIAIPNSVKNIETSAFGSCSGMTSVTIPSSVTGIGNYAFFNCTGLTSVTIPSSVTTIGGYAFYGCSGLTSVVSCITNVFQTGTNAFYGCSNAILYVPKGKKSQYQNTSDWNRITNIQEALFDFCAPNDDGITIYYNIVSEANKTCEVSCGIDKSDFTPVDFAPDYAGVVNIPSSANGYKVIGIGELAFGCCRNLSSLTIPNSVTYIGVNAFFGCCGLASFDIPNSVTRIEAAAFAFNGILTSIDIPNSVTRIEDSAFFWCSGLTSVTIPNSVTYIGDSAFSGCNCLTSMTIPSSVTYIGDKAFMECYLSSITSEIRNVFETGDNAFMMSENATLYVPKGTKSQYQNKSEWNTITNIQELPYSFKLKSAYNDVTIYYTITGTNTCEVTSAVDKNTYSIYTHSNTDETYTGEVFIPSVADGYRVTGIGSKAFMSCGKLTYVSIPNSVKSIGMYAFYDCSSLTTMEIPNSVTSIEGYAFSFCNKLNALTIGNSVSSIGNYAFWNCTGLTSMTIPKSVTSIGKQAFDGCTGLTSVTSEITNVFVTGTDAFYHCEGATLYVPKGLVDTYRATADWNRFSKVVEKGDVNGDGSIDISDVVTLVNAILSSSTMLESNDVNGDGNVDISDVVALVNMILGQ